MRAHTASHRPAPARGHADDAAFAGCVGDFARMALMSSCAFWSTCPFWSSCATGTRISLAADTGVVGRAAPCGGGRSVVAPVGPALLCGRLRRRIAVLALNLHRIRIDRRIQRPGSIERGGVDLVPVRRQRTPRERRAANVRECGNRLARGEPVRDLDDLALGIAIDEQIGRAHRAEWNGGSSRTSSRSERCAASWPRCHR